MVTVKELLAAKICGSGIGCLSAYSIMFWGVTENIKGFKKNIHSLSLSWYYLA